MVQNNTKWNPTDEQARMAQILADPSEQGTITEKCEKAGVSRSTFYRWMRDPNFVEYVNSLIDEYTDAELARVWAALTRKAIEGDIQAIKLFFEMKGKYKEKKEIEHSGSIQFISATPDVVDVDEWNTDH
jgi:Helix-turn-helix of insertion element transposase